MFCLLQSFISSFRRRLNLIRQKRVVTAKILGALKPCRDTQLLKVHNRVKLAAIGCLYIVHIVRGRIAAISPRRIDPGIRPGEHKRMVLPINDPGVPGFRNVPFAGEMKRPQPLGHFVKRRYPVTHIVAAVAGLIRQWWLQREIRSGRLDKMPEIRESAAAGCCGQHATCEKDSLLAAVSRNIEYYEDEELDRFRGRCSDQYSDAEIEEFNEVLTTLRSEEVAGWIRSLQLREIALPDELKDDIILLVGERRADLPH